jgi:hypothetical protein
MSTPGRVGVTTGLVFGVIMAAPVTAQLGPGQGIVSFGLGGAIFGVLVGLMSRQALEPLAGLSSADRATVLRTMQRGLATTDRRLAPSVVGYSEAARRRIPAWLERDGGTRLFYLLAGFQLVQALFNALDRHWIGVAVYVVAGVISVLLPRFNVRTAQRRDQAERSARALLDEAQP